MNLIETKTVVALLFGLLRFAFGILPIQICSWLQPTEQNLDKPAPPLQNHKLLQKVLVLSQCFSGGVLFATCFLYMMPEVYFSIRQLNHDGTLQSRYPYSQLIISLGFFLIYFIEEFCHWLVTITPKTPCKRFVKNNRNVNNVTVVEQAEKVPLKSDQEKDTPVKSLDEEDEDEVESEELDDLLEEGVKTKQQVVRCVLIITAIALHSVFEGLAVGLQHSVTNIWYIFTAISIHSATVLFYMGLTIFLRGVRPKIIILRMLFLASTTPIGVIIGLFISLTADMHSNVESLAVALLEGISAGTILYVTFIETLGKEKERRDCTRTRAVFIGGGFAMMAGLVCITK